MSTAGAETPRSEPHVRAARAKWQKQGDPVMSRSVQTIVSRPEDLTSEQLAELAAVLPAPEVDPP